MRRGQAVFVRNEIKFHSLFVVAVSHSDTQTGSITAPLIVTPAGNVSFPAGETAPETRQKRRPSQGSQTGVLKRSCQGSERSFPGRVRPPAALVRGVGGGRQEDFFNNPVKGGVVLFVIPAKAGIHLFCFCFFLIDSRQ